MPSTARQLDLSRLLVTELHEPGLADAELDDQGYVLATLPATVDRDVPTIALLAHVDVSHDAPSANVQPQVVRYEGGRLPLPGDPSVALDPAVSPVLERHVGHELVTSDGTTLLGADNKAGIAEIMTAAEYLLAHPELERGPVRICFTSDEEIGRGVDGLDLSLGRSRLPSRRADRYDRHVVGPPPRWIVRPARARCARADTHRAMRRRWRRLAPVAVACAAALACASPGFGAVGPTGAFETAVAIEVPPYHGLQPQLALEYDSGTGNGPLGVGWRLTGLSRVHRAGPGGGVPLLTDPSVVSSGPTDTFSLDGLELMPCVPFSTSPSCLYALPGEVGYTGRAETFARVSFAPQSNEWHVWSTTGVRRTYRAGTSLGVKTLAWELATIEDPLGNAVVYRYVAPLGAKGERVVGSISYGGAVIRLRWAPRPDPIVTATGRGLLTSTMRLATIDVWMGADRARAYSLTYKRRTGSGRSFLASVRTFGRNAQLAPDGTVSGGAALPPETFEAASGPAAGAFATSTPIAIGWGPWPASQTAHQRFRDDTLIPWWSKRRWRQWFPGDVDGDGRSDLMGAFLELDPTTPPGGNQWRWVLRTALVNRDGNGTSAYRKSEFPTGWIWHHDPGLDFARTMGGDVNGDGRSDFVVVTKDDSAPTVSVRTAISRGDGQFDVNGTTVPIAGWNPRNRWFTGDVDADGRADLVLVAYEQQCNPACGCTAGSNAEHAAFVVGLSRGDGTYAFAPKQETCWSFAPWDDAGWFLGDADGDGRKDVMRVTNHEPDARATTRHAAFQVALSLGDGSFATQPEFDTAIPWSTYRIPLPYYDQPFGSDLAQSGDFDGDGRTDLVVLGVQQAGSSAARSVVVTTVSSNGDGTFRTAGDVLPSTGPNAFSASNLNFFLTSQLGAPQFPNRWVTGDFDGDGATDLLVVAPRDRDVSQWPTTVTLRRLRSNRDGTWRLDALATTSWFLDCVDRETTVDDSRCPDDLQSYVFAGDVDADGTDDLVYAGLQHVASTGADRTSFRTDVSADTRSDAFRFLPSDLDGDGAADFVYGTAGASGVQIRSLLSPTAATGYVLKSQVQPGTQGLFNPSSRDWRVMDVGAPGGSHGDGRDDVVHLLYYDDGPNATDRGIRTYSFLSDGTGGYTPVVRDAWPAFASRDTVNWRQLDVDGDGAVDLVHLGMTPAGLEVGTLLAKGDGGWRPPITATAWPGFGSSDVSSWRPADVNGDGRADLVHVWKSPGNLRVHVLFSNGDGSWSAVGRDVWPGFSSTDVRHWRTADVNGDGETDLVRVAKVSGSSVRVDALLAHGDGTWTRHSSVAWAGFGPADAEAWQPLEVNGDGRVDLVHLRLGHPGLGVRTLVGHGDGTWDAAPVPFASPASFDPVDTVRWSGADTDGDGRQELVRLDHTGSDLRLSVLRSLSPPDAITGMRTSLGEQTHVQYRRSAAFGVNAPGGVCQVPAGLGFPVVGSVIREPDGVHADVERFWYGCARWSQRTRSLLAWQTVSATRDAVVNRLRAKELRRYDATEACGARITDVQALDDHDRPITRQQSVFAPVGTPPYRCQTMSSRSLEYDGSPLGARNVETQYVYDSFGNVTFAYDLGETQTTGDERTTVTTFHPATMPYIVSLPASQGVYEGLGPVKLGRLSWLCYDGDTSLTCPATPSRGLLTERQDLNVQGLADLRTTTYLYDAFGNVAGVLDARHNGTAMTYDPTFHVYPTSTCNTLGQCSTTTWDPVIGKATAARDVNGRPTAYRYDALGRMTRMATPDGTVTTYAYRDWGRLPDQRIVQRMNDGTRDGLWSRRYLDGLGRTVRAVVEGDAPGRTSEQTTEYTDTSDRVYRRSDWFSPGSTPTVDESGYDEAGRQTRQTGADGTSRRWAYGTDGVQTRVTEFDQAGHATITSFDGYGRIAKVARVMNSTIYSTLEYTYDSLGQPRTITDDRGNVVRQTWDLLGNLVRLDDPDLGVRTYTYDRVGNRLTETDARQQTITYEYDALDRPTTERYPTGQPVLWRYDEPGHANGVGRVTSMSDPSAAGCPNAESQQLSYDALGHVASQVTCVDGKAYALAFRYGRGGRLARTTYPGSEVVTYAYDSAGRLSAIPGLVSHLRYDPAGRLRSISYANGTVETRKYDPRRHWLASQRVVHGPSVVFEARYRRTPTDLLARSQSTTNAMNSGFVYDGLGRLRAVTGEQAQSFTYDSLGNMTSNSAVGTYTYPPPGPTGCSVPGGFAPCAGPHAVGTAGDQTLTYDANGQLSMVVDASGNPVQSIDWTFDHAPSVIGDATGVVTTFGYDGWGNRVSRRRGPETSRWYGPLVEDSTAQGGLVKNYFAGSLLVARRDGGGLHWLHGDGLGSIRAVTDGNGVVTARLDYRAFGELVAPIGATSPALGFTGRQRDADSGLIHLGARDYDPRLGRFISPDSIIPDPTDPQAANRYSYVYNSPANLVDPGGHDPESATPEDDAETREVNADPKGGSGAASGETVIHCHCRETTPPQPAPAKAEPVLNDLPSAFIAAEARPTAPNDPLAISAAQLEDYSRRNMFDSPCPSCHRFRPGTDVRPATPAEKYAVIGIFGTAIAVPTAVAAWEAALAWGSWTVVDTASVMIVQRAPWIVSLVYGGATVAKAGSSVADNVSAESLENTAAELEARANEIHQALDEIAQQQRTTVVVRAATPSGELVDVVAAGAERDLSPAQRAVLAPWEIAAKLPGADAEMTALSHISYQGWTPLALGVTRDMCPDCTFSGLQSGGVQVGPRQMIWPAGWDVK